jgi:hypothetical protein
MNVNFLLVFTTYAVVLRHRYSPALYIYRAGSSSTLMLWKKFSSVVVSLKDCLNPICHLLALLGAHLILHVSRIRVKSIQTLLKRECKNIYVFIMIM